MLIPNFSLHALIPQYRDAGEAFQAFVCDLLKREYPGLEEFPARGKDGCIDFCHTDGNRCLVGDCKFMEDGDFDTAQREWKKVEAKLREHLASPVGPTIGQAQYRPWYCSDPVIDTFFYCINFNLTNLNQVTILENIIKQDFVQLADDFHHLDHLREIQVQALHWQRIKDRLAAHPFVYFYWFRDSFIPGLEPHDSPSQFRGFRAYLGNDKLPYYSIEQHKGLIPTSDGSTILGEEELLDILQSGSNPGIIVTGGGGLGKSRLSLQIARLAKDRDWPVFRVRRISSDTIERLARIVGTASPALLIFDYVETQGDFAQIIEDMVQINDQSGCRLRFVASCRPSFYKAAVKGRVGHLEVTLDKESTWLDGYRHAAIRHILNATGIKPDAGHLRVCKDIPVLAVFMAYLREQGREDELHELIRTEDFGSWVVKRLDAAFGRSAGRDLATLGALFPLPKETVDHLDRDRFNGLFTILAEDGWIEEREWDEMHDGPVWGTVHDVFADGLMLAYLGTVERTADRFVADLFRTAADLGVLRSALTSLQRIVFETPLSHVDWLALFSTQMAENPAPWRGAREMLLQYAGLDPRQRIHLLNRSPEIWEGAEGEVPIQNTIGWIARCLVKDENEVSVAENAILRKWLSKAAVKLTNSNYLLTWGLRLYPEMLSEYALDWFRNHPTIFQTHYLLVAWLEKGLPIATVTEWIIRWSARNAAISHFSFVAPAWLDAGGLRNIIEPYVQAWLDVEANRVSAAAEFVYPSWLDATKDGEFVRADVRAWLDIDANRISEAANFVYKSWLDATKDGEFVRADVRAWLDVEANRISVAAQFLYQSWLDATKDRDFVRIDVQAWLSRFAEHFEADYVCRAWLEAKGEPEVVREPAIRWLRIYHEKEEAVFVTKFLARLPDLPFQAVLDILTWCRIHVKNPDVLWRLTGAANHIMHAETATDFCHTCETIIAHYTVQPHIDEESANQLDVIISYLIGISLRAPVLNNTVDSLFVLWLRHPGSYSEKKAPFYGVQRKSYLQRVVLLLKGQKLNMITDRDVLIRFIHWVNLWRPEKKAQLRGIINHLRNDFPDPDLWDLVMY